MLNRLIVLVAFAALIIAGCGGSKLVGSYDASVNGMPVTANFNGDGTFGFEAKNPAAQEMLIKMTGTYREEGEKLFITFKDVAFENTPAEAKALEGQMKESMKQQLEAGKEKAATIKWAEDGKSFTTTTEDGKSSTFTRKA